MSHGTAIARLATRELWMTFRLLLMLIFAVGAGVVVSVLPAPLPEAMTRLALGLGLAIAVAAAVAAWSIAEGRQAGHAGWLVTRSVARSTYLFGWYAALLLVAVIGLAAGALLGWLAIPAASAIDVVEYVSVLAAIAATLAAATAAGLLAGALLRPRAALLLIAVACAAAGAAVIALPAGVAWLPGGALALLPAAAQSEPVIDGALRAAGLGLVLAAVLLTASRAIFELADL